MGTSRQNVCQSVAACLRSAEAKVARRTAAIGFDGFVDEIIHVVEKRHSLSDYTPVPTIAAMGAKIERAAGLSSNYELVVQRIKLGGNGPIMANALAQFGVKLDVVGSLGYPAHHPVFNELAAKANVQGVVEPGHTDALEFEDGKLLLGKIQSLNDLTWQRLTEIIGIDALKNMFQKSDLVATLNWTMIPYMNDIWRAMLEGGFFGQRTPGRRLFVDLADPEKRTAKEIGEALEIIRQLQGVIDVTLGLNHKESDTIAEVLGISLPADSENLIESTAQKIREKLDLDAVVVHPRLAAAIATKTGSAWFAGRRIRHVKISTGGGDHFNAGIAVGQMLGLGCAETLCVGVATSGFYVSEAASPTLLQLADFVDAMRAESID